MQGGGAETPHLHYHWRPLFRLCFTSIKGCLVLSKLEAGKEWDKIPRTPSADFVKPCLLEKWDNSDDLKRLTSHTLFLCVGPISLLMPWQLSSSDGQVVLSMVKAKKPSPYWWLVFTYCSCFLLFGLEGSFLTFKQHLALFFFLVLKHSLFWLPWHHTLTGLLLAQSSQSPLWALPLLPH